MQWWGWIAWALSLATGMTGLVFALRAERRARYSRLWVVRTEPPRVVNRTGEDASEVLVFVESDEKLLGCLKASTVAPDEELQLLDEMVGASVTITWIRPSSHRMYTWPWTFPTWWRAREIRRVWRRVRWQHLTQELGRPNLDPTGRQKL